MRSVSVFHGICLVLMLVLAVKATASPALAGASMRVTATATYVPNGYTQSETAVSNVVTAIVATVEAAVLTQSQIISRAPGSTVVLSHHLVNTGNIASTYTMRLSNRGENCPTSDLDLGSLQLLNDVNNNGVQDAADVAISINSPASITLAPAQEINLLVRGTLPLMTSGKACMSLVATSGLQTVSVSNQDVIAIATGAVLVLSKSANHGGGVVQGRSNINFNIQAANIGLQDAQPVDVTGSTAATVKVNGSTTRLVLIRDLIPAGTRYLAGSLQTTAANAIRLYRRMGDPIFSFQTTEDPNAVEVAIGLTTAVRVNTSLAFQFAVAVDNSLESNVRNVAEAYYFDGSSSVMTPSNVLIIGSNFGLIGIAKQASIPISNIGVDGLPDGTANVRFQLNIRNYGSAWLYGVQASDVLEGMAPENFGTYTSALVPAASQYTVVPGSLKITNAANIRANPAFAGTSANQQLLAAGGELGPHAEATILFDVRVNLAGRTANLSNTAKASAAVAVGAPPSVFDDSVDGLDPDPDGDNNPNNNSSPSVVMGQLPVLRLVKTASLPRRIAAGVYDFDYTLKVTNTGNAPAPNVRVIDNLNCAFNMDLPDRLVDSWELLKSPRARNGSLNPSSAFTGREVCKRSQQSSTDPYDLPTEISLSATDGSRALGAGQTEEITFTVRVYAQSKEGMIRAPLTNKAWAASFSQNTIGFDPKTLLSATAASAQSLLMDPQGVIYDAATRQPIEGAVVTYTRQSCVNGKTGPILPAEILGGNSAAYTFNANGSVSLTTGQDGQYQFFLNSPPVDSRCTYALTVSPPAGSFYSTPSELLPVTSGTFTTCGAVVANAGAPKPGDPTTYYGSVISGVDGLGGASCYVVNNHIPLDPGNIRGLVLRMEGSKRFAEMGDFVDFALTVTNRTGAPVKGFVINNTLPIGFGYLAGSTQLNGIAAGNPKGGAGPQLTFEFPDFQILPEASATVRYRVRIGVGAPTNGDVVNRASAHAGPLQSNLASWSLRVAGGVFSDEAFAFGKVYLDCNRDGVQQGAREIGIPGVRLYMETGTYVITDGDGKWSLYGLKPVTHVLRVDETTLPSGARLDILDNKNSGSPASRFVDLVKGEFHKADFIVVNCDNEAVVAEVTARRALIQVRSNAEGEAQMRVRLDPESRVAVVSDSRGQPASGQSAIGGGIGGQLASVTAPLIALPAISNGGPGSRFIGAIGGAGGTLGSVNSALPAAAGSLFAPLSGLPASAQASTVTAGPTASPGGGDTRPLATSGAMVEPRSVSILPIVKPSVIDLEVLLPGLANNALGFIDLKDGDTLPAQSINVRVKGEAGVTIKLMVNGALIDQARVGKKATLAERQLIAWEYIGVVLRPGRNELSVEATDSFGNARGSASVIHLIAPDRLSAVKIDAPPSARADARTAIVVKVALVDASGVPVTARTQLTLESDRGRWLDEDLSATERGTQVFMDGGHGEFRLLPPAEPGNARIRVSTGEFAGEVTIALLPDLRPMIGVGLLEGVIDLTKRGQLPLGALPAGAAFENELSSLGGDHDNARVAGRSAFFLKGALKGEYLLTASFDSNKQQKDRLFRDIRPDEFYPVYGDSSIRGFDAQSTQRLYVRVDKDRSYLLYGDFTTASSTEVRSLSQSNRTLTGAKGVYDDEKVRVTSYAANTSQAQQVEEFRALGISGPYYLSAVGGVFVDNSEQVEIIVRDRAQPNIVLQRTSVTRFVDYTMESLTRRLLFTRPISSVDANLNPQSIRVTYEVDSGGEKFIVAGTDAQFKVSDQLQVGVVASTDRNPQNQRDLAAVTALARLGTNATLAAELVQTQSDAKSDGTGVRAEVRLQDEKLAAVAAITKTTAGFDNPASSMSSGRTDASARAEYRLDPSLAVRGEALYSKDVTNEQNRSGATLSVQKKLSESTTVEAGIRRGQSNTTLGSSSGFDYGATSTYNGALGSSLSATNTTSMGTAATNSGGSGASQLSTVRARISTLVPGLPGAQAFVEGEQSLSESDRQTLAIGANYALTEKTRAYGRYELISGLYGPFEVGGTQINNTGILGIESAYMEGGRVYNEYRLADSADGRGVIAALGLRNTYQVTERIRVTGGLEHTRNLSSVSNSVNNGTGYGGTLGESTSITGGIEYNVERLKISAILEARDGSDSNTLLFSAGAGYKISPEFSLLARSVVSDSTGQGMSAGNERQLQRHQVGVAYRPVDSNFWNALARYEHKSDRVVGSGNSSGSAFSSGSGIANLPGTFTTDIIAAHVNVNPQRGTYLSSRYAVKVSRAEDSNLANRYWAHLLQGRMTQDLNPEWNIGFQAGVLYGQGGALQKTLGTEVGYQLYRDIWLSLGYNVIGLVDHDLAANEYTSEGFYLRLRMKFDETSLGFQKAGINTPPGVQSAPAVGPPTSLLRDGDAPNLGLSDDLGASAARVPVGAQQLRTEKP